MESSVVNKLENNFINHQAVAFKSCLLSDNTGAQTRLANRSRYFMMVVTFQLSVSKVQCEICWVPVYCLTSHLLTGPNLEAADIRHWASKLASQSTSQ